MILFIALPEPQDKTVAEADVFPLALLPRRCPRCGKDSIIGHGRRRKQAHDECHDWIWVRRGLCLICELTFTILPLWSPPSGHYSYVCRQQAWESACSRDGGWERSVPETLDPNRSPDPATLRRWAFRRLLSLLCNRKIFGSFKSAWLTFLRPPTILAWDWIALHRNLHLEANSP